jgi:two-component system response regulator NreC
MAKIVLADEVTEREIAVLRLIAFGHTNAEVAERLHVSVRTVETHRARVQQKLGLSSRSQLVRYALEQGFLQVPERVAASRPHP